MRLNSPLQLKYYHSKVMCWIFLTIHCINSQCYIDSGKEEFSMHYNSYNFSSLNLAAAFCILITDISIYQSGYHANGDDQCLGNYTVINVNLINGTADKGITCSRRYSTSMSGTWKQVLETSIGNTINCDDSTKSVRCVRKRPGSVTLYTQLTDPSIRLDRLPEGDGTYSCCIEGLCISIRLFQEYPMNDYISE